MDNKKISPFFRITFSVIFLIVGVYICVSVVQSGLTRVKTQSMLRSAEKDWRNGYILNSLKRYGHGIWMILEGGSRWLVAQVFLEQSKNLCCEGQFSEALDKCVIADRVLTNGYDNEDAVGYECFLIDTRIQYPEHFSSSAPRPCLSSGLENTKDE